MMFFYIAFVIITSPSLFLSLYFHKSFHFRVQLESLPLFSLLGD
jgi:hypothetical protein